MAADYRNIFGPDNAELVDATNRARLRTLRGVGVPWGNNPADFKRAELEAGDLDSQRQAQSASDQSYWRALGNREATNADLGLGALREAGAGQRQATQQQFIGGEAEKDRGWKSGEAATDRSFETSQQSRAHQNALDVLERQQGFTKGENQQNRLAKVLGDTEERNAAISKAELERKQALALEDKKAGSAERIAAGRDWTQVQGGLVSALAALGKDKDGNPLPDLAQLMPAIAARAGVGYGRQPAPSPDDTVTVEAPTGERITMKRSEANKYVANGAKIVR